MCSRSRNERFFRVKAVDCYGIGPFSPKEEQRDGYNDFSDRKEEEVSEGKNF